jgi:hypothetical protein
LSCNGESELGADDELLSAVDLDGLADELFIVGDLSIRMGHLVNIQ